MTRRINQITEVQQIREEVNEKLQRYQDKMKAMFDKKGKDREFLLGDLVLKWEARREDVGNMEKLIIFALVLIIL